MSVNQEIARDKSEAYLLTVSTFEAALAMLAEDTVFSVDSLHDTSTLTVMTLMKSKAEEIKTQYGIV